MRLIGVRHLADFTVLVSLLALANAIGFAGQCDVALVLDAPQREVDFTSDFPGSVSIDAVLVSLRNVGHDPIVLVEPGDGSDPPDGRN